jgi:hypothetical protein
MAKNTLISKKVQIDKSQAKVALVIACASFLVVFALVSSRSLLSKRSFQSRVNSEKSKTLTQLKNNNQSVSQLIESYKLFVDPKVGDNIIGGNPGGTGPNDGDNARIVLDALPSQYDFPALASSIEKILKLNSGYKINSITAADQSSQNSSQTPIALSTSTGTQAVAMPFQVDVAGGSDSIISLIDNLSRSIRPIQITKIKLTSGTGGINAVISAQTYYQPESNVDITTKEIR